MQKLQVRLRFWSMRAPFGMKVNYVLFNSIGLRAFRTLGPLRAARTAFPELWASRALNALTCKNYTQRQLTQKECWSLLSKAGETPPLYFCGISDARVKMSPALVDSSFPC